MVQCGFGGASPGLGGQSDFDCGGCCFILGLFFDRWGREWFGGSGGVGCVSRLAVATVVGVLTVFVCGLLAWCVAVKSELGKLFATGY